MENKMIIESIVVSFALVGFIVVIEEIVKNIIAGYKKFKAA